MAIKLEDYLAGVEARKKELGMLDEPKVDKWGILELIAEARLDLTGALIDIQTDGIADEITLQTIRDVLKQLGRVEQMLKGSNGTEKE